MKTHDEYVQENKILHYLYAEVIDLDDDRVDNTWEYWKQHEDQKTLNRSLRRICINVLMSHDKYSRDEAEAHLDHIIQDKIAEVKS